MEIAFIAPYDRMRTIAQSIVDHNYLPVEVLVGNMEAGVRAARRALRDGAKVIISRGLTARLIREAFNIEVVEVKVSGNSVLAFLYERTTLKTRIALTGFKHMLDVAEPICATLKRQYAVFELGGGRSSHEVMNDVEAFRPDVIIGDALAVNLAEGRSLKHFLVESTEATMAEALDQGVQMLGNLKRHLDNTDKLTAVLNCTQEGAALVSHYKMVEEINSCGCELLGLSREQVIGSDFRQVFGSSELNEALRLKKNLRNVLMSISGQQFVLDLTVVNPKADKSPAVVLFQKVKNVQETESRIRKKLFAKGFVARYTFDDIVRQSRAMNDLIEVAKAYSATECGIMIRGETGTGKELFAQSMHNASGYGGGPFVAVNCAALPGTLLESELFGYAPGAFTGALKSGKTGLFELAHNGTLFLDEITEMDIFLQPRLLRALQSHEIMRLGDERVIPVKVRVIAATNKDPAEAVRQGKLRADLFFRLNVLDLHIPPLRERPGDAAHIFLHFLSRLGRGGERLKKPAPAYLKALNQAPWPGNVRELENFAEKYATLSRLPGSPVPAPPLAASAAPAILTGGSLNEAIKGHAQTVLLEESGNISRAARRLGVSRNTLKRRLGLAAGIENGAQ
ncbi:hypothetical protein C4J81_09480 [Deltaproteobacteria bacterium Smac51]|nr:hypothetical protein C4J81_09480 [Deltaproteobacteria bacterium Smac51]